MNSEEEQVSKLIFEDVLDFKFSAAYEAYSKAFDEVLGAEQRRHLNDLVSQLSKDEISYGQFYGEINRFREYAGGHQFRRARIQGQRKRAYRRDQVERDRSKRHKR